jgi:UV DNA damage repair endonuclease
MASGKIGFACKWIDHPDQINGIKPTDNCKQFNTSTTTIAWLNRQTPAVAEQKLWDLLKHNIESVTKLVTKVSTLATHLKMVRLSSDILPVFTAPDWKYFYKSLDVRAYCELAFSKVGEIARANNVRLSMHPGQFVVLASDNPGIVDRSVEEFEYHATMAAWMGYGKQFQDFKINVHVSGRQGPPGIKLALQRLSPEARNCITIENDEMTWGIDASLELANDVALVLDIHHHYINTGEYIEVSDNRIKRITDSWRGQRPVIHYSVSREDCLVDHSKYQRPDLRALLAAGLNKTKLRAHSDFMWNQAVNDWALTHSSWADIMVECKAKNLGSFALANYATETGIY